MPRQLTFARVFSASRIGVCILALGLAVIVSNGCQRKDAGPPPTPPPAKVTVAKPVSYPVQTYYEYNGHLEAVGTVEVRARVKGILDKVHFTEGEEIEEDAPLYTIDPREYRTAVARATADQTKAAAEIDNWKAQIKLAEAELSRLNRLPAGTVTQSEIDKAKATVDINVAQLAVAKAALDAATAALQTANIQLGYTNIRAKIAGRIGRTLITQGNLVGQDQTTLLTTIVSVDPMYVKFDAPERDLLKYYQADPTKKASQVPIEIAVTGDIGFPHRGVIDFRDNKVDISTATIGLRGRVPNPMNPQSNKRPLFAGLYAKIRVPAGPRAPRLVVPEDALMTGQDGRFVYVVGPDNMVLKKNVTVGTRVWQALSSNTPAWGLLNADPEPAPNSPLRQQVRSIVAIESGLDANDRVIVIGLQKARPGAPVAPENWELRPPRENETKSK
jgi:RND family efflux transporter MFP subunit